MNVNAKIKLLAETFTGYSVLIDSSNGANVELSKMNMPCILVFIQENGEYQSTNSHYRDSVNVKIVLLNKINNGFKDSDVDTMRYNLKTDAVLLYHRLKFDFEFKVNSDAIKYEIVYDEFDDNLIGVTFSDTIKERVGLNLACEAIESVGSTPNSIDFCQRVSECSSIIELNSLIESLQDQINNLPAGFSCEDLPACQEIIDIIQSIDDLGTSLVTQINNLETTVENYIIYNNESIAAIIQSISDVNTALQDSISTLNTQLLGYIESNDQAITEINNLILSLAQTTQDLDSAIQAVASDLTLKEDIANKVTNFNVPDNVTYPTTQATIDLIDNRVQSNIKIIGDWDASSGSYPLADESNTTPFIAQWGPIIKAGWAFRVGYGQQGTVDGLDYENGDVVYALIDSPSNASVDWGDLDHNLQQANESLRGTAKIITAAIIEDETTLDDERIVTGKKLWANFWNRVLDLAHTWAAKQTFTTAPRFNSATPSQYLKTDASKNLVSVSAIPATDVTEDSTHRFATDTEKTIWNAKASNFINKKNSDTPHTGTTSPTVIHSFEITPGTCEANDVLKFYIRHLSTNNANSKTVKIWANSSNTISGATQLSNYAYTTNSGGVLAFKRSLIFKNSLTSQKIINTTWSHANDEVSYPNNGDATLSLNFNNSVFIFIEVTLANAADTFTMNLFNCKIER